VAAAVAAAAVVALPSLSQLMLLTCNACIPW
jgi:hypothetical protein